MFPSRGEKKTLIIALNSNVLQLLTDSKCCKSSKDNTVLMKGPFEITFLSVKMHHTNRAVSLFFYRLHFTQESFRPPR